MFVVFYNAENMTNVNTVTFENFHHTEIKVFFFVFLFS